MAELTSYERIKQVLNRQEPDRVPHFEWTVNRRVREALLPGCGSAVEFAARMDYDSVLVDVEFSHTPVGPGRWKSEWGYVAWYGSEDAGIEVECPIATQDDLDRYVPPDVSLPGRYAALERVVAEFKGRRAIGVNLHDVLSFPRRWMGLENLLLALITDPELVRALVDLSVRLNLQMAREAAARGADFVWTSDDWAGNKGLLMSPRHFRALLYPAFCRWVRGCKELGLWVIKHTDGNVCSILDLLVESGIDALDPIDPQAGMNLGVVKQQYGKRLALKGNVDCAWTLGEGTREQVVEATLAALRQGAAGGGYILSSSNSIHSGVKPDNYRAMLETLARYGRYPLNLPEKTL